VAVFSLSFELENAAIFSIGCELGRPALREAADARAALAARPPDTVRYLPATPEAGATRPECVAEAEAEAAWAEAEAARAEAEVARAEVEAIRVAAVAAAAASREELAAARAEAEILRQEWAGSEAAQEEEAEEAGARPERRGSVSSTTSAASIASSSAASVASSSASAMGPTSLVEVLIRGKTISLCATLCRISIGWDVSALHRGRVGSGSSRACRPTSPPACQASRSMRCGASRLSCAAVAPHSLRGSPRSAAGGPHSLRGVAGSVATHGWRGIACRFS
jgi:hypothetical protein